MEDTTISKIIAQINEDIKDNELRIIGPNGDQLGIMSAAEANALADKHNLDLVKISPNAKPPVCRIMDYGKYRFDQAKKEKELKKNQKVIELKEVQLSMTIEMHDMEIKAKNAIKFLKADNKVKVALRMRGRQQAFADKGLEVVKQFAAMVEEYGDMEREPKREGRNIIVIIGPKKK